MKNGCRLILTKQNRYLVLILLIAVLRLKRSLHLFAFITQLKTTDTPYKTKKKCRESIINKVLSIIFYYTCINKWMERQMFNLVNNMLIKTFIKSTLSFFFLDFSSVSIHFSSTTIFITMKEEIECKNFLMFATIGVIVVALIVVVLYIYTWMLEKRLFVSRIIQMT